MMEFIRELISERWIKVRMGGSISQNTQTDLGIPQGGVLDIILFLFAINGILGRIGIGVELSVSTCPGNINYNKNQRVASRALQGVTNKLDAWTAERGVTFPLTKQ